MQHWNTATRTLEVDRLDIAKQRAFHLVTQMLHDRCIEWALNDNADGFAVYLVGLLAHCLRVQKSVEVNVFVEEKK